MVYVGPGARYVTRSVVVVGDDDEMRQIRAVERRAGATPAPGAVAWVTETAAPATPPAKPIAVPA